MTSRNILFGLVSSLALVACAKRLGAVAPARAAVGQPLEMRLPRFPDKQSYDLRQDRGKVVVIDVWATWCEPCLDALTLFQELWDRFQERGLRVYALNVDEDPGQIPPFLKENHIRLPVLRDVEARFAEQTLNVQGLPTSVLVDRRGVVRRIHEGFVGGPSGPLAGEIEALLAEPAP